MKRSGYFDHDADIGIIGRGATVEESFVAAAEAMFSIMAETLPERLEVEIGFEFEEKDTEFALVQWLNTLLAYAQSRAVIPGKFELRREGEIWHARAWGTPWNAQIRHGIEVKGATLTMLGVEEKEGVWEARCIVDV